MSQAELKRPQIAHILIDSVKELRFLEPYVPDAVVRTRCQSPAGQVEADANTLNAKEIVDQEELVHQLRQWCVTAELVADEVEDDLRWR